MTHGQAMGKRGTWSGDDRVVGQFGTRRITQSVCRPRPLSLASRTIAVCSRWSSDDSCSCASVGAEGPCCRRLCRVVAHSKDRKRRRGVQASAKAASAADSSCEKLRAPSVSPCETNAPSCAILTARGSVEAKELEAACSLCCCERQPAGGALVGFALGAEGGSCTVV